MRSIRHELTARVLRSVLPLIVLGAGAVYVAVRQVLLFEFDSALRQEARVLQAVTERVGPGIDFDYKPGKSPQTSPDFGQDYRFELTLSDGTLLKRSDGLRADPLPAFPGELGRDVVGPIRLPNGHRARGCTVLFEPKEIDPATHQGPLDVANAPPGPVRLVIAASTRDLDSLLASLAVTEALVGLLLLAATVLAVRRSLREGLAPVDILASQVTAFEPDKLTSRVDADGQPGELKPIAARINQLLERLEEAFTREKRFTANAAHELRTPIAEIRAIAEVACDNPDPAGQRHGLREIVKVSQEMQGMISNLLAMARVRSGTLVVERKRVELSPLLIDWCAKREGLHPGSGLRIGRSVPPGVWAETDPVVLGAVVTNLLDNAATYTPRGGDITLRLDRADAGARITVENTCEPLDDEDVRGMFEPFWRKRGTSVEGSHSGLGLALVRSMCDAIQVSVSAQLLSPRRIAVSVLIPA